MQQNYLQSSRLKLNSSLNASSNISLDPSYNIKSRTKRNSKKYYKVLYNQSSELDKLPKMNPFQMQKFIKNLNSSNKYMYLDITEESGMKVMQKCDEQEDQSEQLGNNYIANLYNLSDQNNKSLNYLFQQKQIIKMKEASSSLIKKQLERSEEKVKKRARFFNSYLSQKKDEPKVRIYKNMDRNLLQKYKNIQEYETINSQIKEKQSKLLEYYQRLQSKYPITTNLTIKSVKQFTMNSALPTISRKINTIHI